MDIEIVNFVDGDLGDLSSGLGNDVVGFFLGWDEGENVKTNTDFKRRTLSERR